MRIILALLLVISGIAHADTVPTVNPKQAIVIDGVISRGNIDDLGDYLYTTKNKVIDIVISSPGGDVITGFNFISSMEAAKAQGKLLRCFVNQMAASMAFGILVHCDERYSLNNSFLLWHRARVFVGGLMGTPMTSPDAHKLSVQLGLLDEQIYAETSAALNVNNQWVRWHFENETLHTGYSLSNDVPAFIQAYDNIPGLQEAMRNEKLPRTKKASLFEFRLQLQPGQLIYIRRGLVD